MVHGLSRQSRNVLVSASVFVLLLIAGVVVVTFSASSPNDKTIPLQAVGGVGTLLAFWGLVWYTLETREQRLIAAKQLAQLRAEHKARYESFVALGGDVVDHLDRWKLEITDLGPGPAQRIDVTALSRPVKDKAPQVRMGAVWGLPVAGKTEVELFDVVALVDQDPFAEFPKDIGAAQAIVKVVVWTVIKEAMPPQWFPCVIVGKKKIH